MAEEDRPPAHLGLLLCVSHSVVYRPTVGFPPSTVALRLLPGLNSIAIRVQWVPVGLGPDPRPTVF